MTERSAPGLPTVETDEIPVAEETHPDGRDEYAVGGEGDTKETIYMIGVGDVITFETEANGDTNIVLANKEQEYIAWNVEKSQYETYNKSHLYDDMKSSDLEINVFHDPYDLREPQAVISFNNDTAESFINLVYGTLLPSNLVEATKEGHQITVRESLVGRSSNTEEPSAEMEEDSRLEDHDDLTNQEHRERGHIKFSNDTNSRFRVNVIEALELSDFISVTGDTGNVREKAVSEIYYE